ncbi:MAG: OmpA family protein [Nonlabens sp.]
MKNFYLLFALLMMGSLTVNAQGSSKKADKLFTQKRYLDAAKAYEKAVEKGARSQEVYTNLANSYYYNSDYKNAVKYFKKATEKDADAEMVYRLAQSQKAIENYEESNRSLEKFASMMPGDARAKMFRSNPNYINEILDMPAAYEAKGIMLNTDASDFAALRTNGKIYFSSSRNSTRSNYGRNKQPYLDIYEVAARDGDTLGNPVLLRGDVNTKFHEGTLAVTKDGKYMFFTRVDYYEGDYEKASDGESKLGIYRAVNAGGEWRDIQTTSLRAEEYGVGHPSITSDGNTIYFASEAPGGQGGTDIYKADLNNGIISNPVNLGPKVNTPGDDSFPYMASDGTLYFASNGHLGLGGLDVFMYKNGEVKNMGVGVNSPLDDFAFTYDVEAETGYVSSNRDGGKGSDDIYKISPVARDVVDIMVEVRDAETNEVISNAIVSIGVEKGEDIPAQNTNDMGKTQFTVDDMQEIQVYTTIAGYESGEAIAQLDNTRDEVTLQITMKPEPKIVEDKIVLNKIFFDLDKAAIRPDAALELDRLVSLMQKNPNLEIMAETYADSRGADNYNMALTERRAQSIIDYVSSKGIDASRLSAAGRGEANPVIDCVSKKCSEEEYEASRRSEFTITKK